VYYLYAIQDPRTGLAIKSVSSGAEYGTLPLAQAVTWAQIRSLYPSLADQEIRPLYKLIYEYRSAYDVAIKKAALRERIDIRRDVAVSTSASGSVPLTSTTRVATATLTSLNGESALLEVDGKLSRPNILINTNGLDPINQEGNTTVANGAYGFDMWKLAHDCTTVTISATATGMRHTATTKGAGTVVIGIQEIENVTPYKGKTLTASIKATSIESGAYIRIYDGIGYTDQTITAGVTTSVTHTVSTSASTLNVQVNSGTIAADGDYIEWEWIKLEEGSVATPYVIPSKGDELIGCKRHFQRIKSSGAYGGVGLGFGGTSTIGFIMRFLDVPMRALPALASSTPANMLVYGDGSQIALTSLGINSDNSCLDGSGACISVGMTIGVASGLPVDHAIYVRWNNDANGYIDLSARL
jgi:hypothetical protein